MDAKKIEVKEEIPASRKLSAADAREIAKGSSKVYVAKGKKLDVFDIKKADLNEVVERLSAGLPSKEVWVARADLVGVPTSATRAVRKAEVVRSVLGKNSPLARSPQGGFRRPPDVSIGIRI